MKLKQIKLEEAKCPKCSNMLTSENYGLIPCPKGCEKFPHGKTQEPIHVGFYCKKCRTYSLIEEVITPNET